MKKFYTLFALLIVSSLAFAQKHDYYEHHTGKALKATGMAGSAFFTKAAGTPDTLDQYFVAPRTTGYTIFGVGSGGFVFGTSNDGSGNKITEGTAVHYDDVGSINVDEVMVWIATKEIIGSADNIELSLWTANATDSLPLTLLASETISMMNVDTGTQVNFATGQGLNIWSYTTGVPQVVNEDFLVALTYGSIDDTLGIVSNQLGNGAGEARAKQNVPALGGWVPANAVWVGGLDADPVMIPIVSTFVGAEDPKFENDHFVVRPAYPNPSTASVNLDVELAHETTLQVTIWDQTGRLVYNSGANWTPQGQHKFTIDVSQIPAGNYYYTVKTSETVVNSKLQVLH